MAFPATRKKEANHRPPQAEESDGNRRLFLLDLPPELKWDIVNRLDARAFGRAMCISKAWRDFGTVVNNTSRWRSALSSNPDLQTALEIVLRKVLDAPFRPDFVAVFATEQYSITNLSEELLRRLPRGLPMVAATFMGVIGEDAETGEIESCGCGGKGGLVMTMGRLPGFAIRTVAHNLTPKQMPVATTDGLMYSIVRCSTAMTGAKPAGVLLCMDAHYVQTFGGIHPDDIGDVGIAAGFVQRSNRHPRLFAAAYNHTRNFMVEDPGPDPLDSTLAIPGEEPPSFVRLTRGAVALTFTPHNSTMFSREDVTALTEKLSKAKAGPELGKGGGTDGLGRGAGEGQLADSRQERIEAMDASSLEQGAGGRCLLTSVPHYRQVGQRYAVSIAGPTPAPTDSGTQCVMRIACTHLREGATPLSTRQLLGELKKEAPKGLESKSVVALLLGNPYEPLEGLTLKWDSGFQHLELHLDMDMKSESMGCALKYKDLISTVGANIEFYIRDEGPDVRRTEALRFSSMADALFAPAAATAGGEPQQQQQQQQPGTPPPPRGALGGFLVTCFAIEFRAEEFKRRFGTASLAGFVSTGEVGPPGLYPEERAKPPYGATIFNTFTDVYQLFWHP